MLATERLHPLHQVGIAHYALVYNVPVQTQLNINGCRYVTTYQSLWMPFYFGRRYDQKVTDVSTIVDVSKDDLFNDTL